MKSTRFLAVLAMVFIGCSDSSFNGGGITKSSNKSKDDSSSGNESEELGDEDDIEDDSETAVVATVPENVAGAYLTCVSDQQQDGGSGDNATLGCVVFDQSRTNKLNFAGLDTRWTITMKDSGEVISFDSLRISGSNKVHSLLRTGAGNLGQPVKVSVHIKGTDKEMDVSGEYPDANAANIPYMAEINVKKEIETAKDSTRRHRIFVTHKKYGPAGEIADGRFSGVKGADTACAAEAAAAGLSGSASWKAVIGDTAASAYRRISIRYKVYRIGDEQNPVYEPKWFGLDEEEGKDPDKDSKSDSDKKSIWDIYRIPTEKFFASGRTVTVGADGKPAFAAGDSSEAKTWTGSGPDGKSPPDGDANTNFCGDWKTSDATATGIYSLADTMEKWLNDGKDSCDKQYRLLCISQ